MSSLGHVRKLLLHLLAGRGRVAVCSIQRITQDQKFGLVKFTTRIVLEAGQGVKDKMLIVMVSRHRPRKDRSSKSLAPPHDLPLRA
jgi:hypothetical protein